VDIGALRRDQRRKAICACLTRWGVTFQRGPARIDLVEYGGGQYTRRYKKYDCTLLGPGGASASAEVASSLLPFLPDMQTMLLYMDWFAALEVVGQTYEHWYAAGLARDTQTNPGEYSEFEDVELAREVWDKWQLAQLQIQRFCHQVEVASGEQSGSFWAELCRLATT
jgi:hypothetical protein